MSTAFGTCETSSSGRTSEDSLLRRVRRSQGSAPAEPFLIPVELVANARSYNAPMLSTPVKRWTVIAAVLGSSVVFLDGTVINVALPRIGRELPVHFVGVLEGQS